MKPKHVSKDLIVWQEAPRHQDNNPSKVVELEAYRLSQKPIVESTILSWDIPTVDPAKSVKLLMVSSGFTIRGLGGNSIQSMAA
jgi:hypothetical protein